MNEAYISQIVGVVLQLAVVFLVATVWWFAFGRRSSFWRYVGLYSANSRAIGAALLLGVGLPAIMLAVHDFRALAASPGTVVGTAVAQFGVPGSIPLLVLLAGLKTAFAEELLFRGLIGKRLIAWLGFGRGNALQALIFGAIHLAILTNMPTGISPIAAPALIVMVTCFGWANGWLNERLGGGSILPGWIAHALANLITYLTLALLVLG